MDNQQATFRLPTAIKREVGWLVDCKTLFLKKAYRPTDPPIFSLPREALELLTSLPDNTASLIFLDPQYEKVGTVLKLDYPLSYTSDYQILRILEQIERVLKPNRSFGNVWEESQLASNKRKHPHQKPRELVKALITATTNEGDLIVDPCAGSFVVLDACQELKREFIDLVYKFCEEKGIKNNSFEIQEQGLFYLGKRRIYFFDLFSFRKARGKIARGTTFQEI
ncbi:14678_t:CDS:2, partial [Racocetra fulgida]